MKLHLIFIILFCISAGSSMYAGSSPADAYYQQNLAVEATPADSYYNNNLRAVPPPPPEEGDGEIGGGFVGGEDLPLGGSSIPSVLLMGLVALLYKHKRMNRVR